MNPIQRKRDARSLDHHTLQELRYEIVRRREAGESRTTIAESLQINKTTVSKIYSKYRKGGVEALASTKAPGPAPKLSPLQLKRLRKTIISKNPQQLQFSFALWTIPLVCEYIRRTYGVVYHETSVGRLLHRMGITPQKPVRRAFKRNEEECLHWAQTEFPRIVKRTVRKQAVLLFLDEAGVHEDGPIAHTWAERGNTPVVRVTGGRQKVNVISAISPRGRLWFRCFPGTLNGEKFLAFLKALLHDIKGKIHLILDSHPAHKATSVMRFLEENKHRLEVYFLPGYAPDLNPDEHVWSYLKGLFRRQPLESEEELMDAVYVNMSDIQSNPNLVKSFFRHPAVAYVRDALHWN